MGQQHTWAPHFLCWAGSSSLWPRLRLRRFGWRTSSARSLALLRSLISQTTTLISMQTTRQVRRALKMTWSSARTLKNPVGLRSPIQSSDFYLCHFGYDQPDMLEYYSILKCTYHHESLYHHNITVMQPSSDIKLNIFNKSI